MKPIKLALLATAFLAGLVGPIQAQNSEHAGQATERRGGPPAPGRGAERPPGPEGRRLPADSVTRHTLELPGRSLTFTATAGSLPLTDPEGRVQAEVGYVSYTVDGADPATRPVTIALNGGPGAASAYLHLGVLGPWRLPLDGRTLSPSRPPDLVPNAETWLDFTDLVFIDPPGTGFSRVANDDARNRFFSVDGDIDMLAAVVNRWFKERERLRSPKFFVGESYGGFRGPLLTEKLQGDQGIGLSGLVLLSPVIDFSLISDRRWQAMGHVARLPSLAAAAREVRGEPVTREALAEAERYASGEYLVDLTRGFSDKLALGRLGENVARLTGLNPALARRLGGRIDPGTFQREIGRAEGRVSSAYDTGISSYDPDPTSPRSQFEDPGLTGMTAPLTSAIVDHLSRTLNWRVDNARYELLNGAVNGAWRWPRGRAATESLGALRNVMALDENLTLLVVHGYTDLVTPYYASQLVLNQLPDLGGRDRARLAVYPGGHMFYSRDASRQAFRADAERMFREALERRGRAVR